MGLHEPVKSVQEQYLRRGVRPRHARLVQKGPEQAVVVPATNAVIIYNRRPGVPASRRPGVPAARLASSSFRSARPGA
jgi:hypothetical protein